jgi:hypothetical protein
MTPVLRVAVLLTIRAMGVWGESQFCATVRDSARLAAPVARTVIKPLAAAVFLQGVTRADGRLCKMLAPGGYLVRAEKDQFAGTHGRMLMASVGAAFHYTVNQHIRK